jgi:Mrp family chromosome partitioning ATPase
MAVRPPSRLSQEGPEDTMSDEVMSYANRRSDPSASPERHGEPLWVHPSIELACRDVLRRVRERGGTSIGVTSARRHEGRTTIAWGLATETWGAGRRPTVLLDTASGGAHRPDKIGLSDVLSGDLSILDAIEWVAPDLGVITAGHAVREASDVGALRSIFVVRDLEAAGLDIVADLPPLPPVGVGDRLAALFSVTLLVVKAGSTRLELVRQTAATLPQNPLVVLNGTSSAIPNWIPGLGGR